MAFSDNVKLLGGEVDTLMEQNTPASMLTNALWVSLRKASSS